MEISYRQYKHQQAARPLKSGPETTEHAVPAEWFTASEEHVPPANWFPASEAKAESAEQCQASEQTSAAPAEHTPPAEWHSGGVNSEHVWPGQQVQSGDYSLHYLFAQ